MSNDKTYIHKDGWLYGPIERFQPKDKTYQVQWEYMTLKLPKYRWTGPALPDWKEMVEGVDFEIENQFWTGSFWCSREHLVDGIVKPGTKLRSIAIPILQNQPEDSAPTRFTDPYILFDGPYKVSEDAEEYLANIPSMIGMSASGSTKAAAFQELMKSFAVQLAYNSGISSKELLELQSPIPLQQSHSSESDYMLRSERTEAARKRIQESILSYHYNSFIGTRSSCHDWLPFDKISDDEKELVYACMTDYAEQRLALRDASPSTRGEKLYREVRAIERTPDKKDDFNLIIKEVTIYVLDHGWEGKRNRV